MMDYSEKNDQSTKARMVSQGWSCQSSKEELSFEAYASCGLDEEDCDAQDEEPPCPPRHGDHLATESPKELGVRGENAAVELLKRKGYFILERNWTCPAGEADIIALDEGCLVFVEVKTRTGVDHGLPLEAVTAKKRARYERIAGYYLDEYDGEDARVRFDVIGIQVLSHNRAFVRHIVNAFGRGE